MLPGTARLDFQATGNRVNYNCCNSGSSHVIDPATAPQTYPGTQGPAQASVSELQLMKPKLFGPGLKVTHKTADEMGDTLEERQHAYLTTRQIFRKEMERSYDEEVCNNIFNHAWTTRLVTPFTNQEALNMVQLANQKTQELKRAKFLEALAEEQKRLQEEQQSPPTLHSTRPSLERSNDSLHNIFSQMIQWGGTIPGLPSSPNATFSMGASSEPNTRPAEPKVYKNGKYEPFNSNTLIRSIEKKVPNLLPEGATQEITSQVMNRLDFSKKVTTDHVKSALIGSLAEYIVTQGQNLPSPPRSTPPLQRSINPHITPPSNQDDIT